MSNKVLTIVVMLFACYTNIYAAKNPEMTEHRIRKYVVDGCEAICSSSFEKENIQRIEQLCELFNLKTTKELLELKKKRICDRGDSLSIESLSEIEDVIETKYPKTYSFAYIRMIRGFMCHTELLRKEYLLSAFEYAKELPIEKDDIETEELRLVSELAKMANSTYIYGPTEYEAFRKVQCKLNVFYEQHDIYTYLRQCMVEQCLVYLGHIRHFNAYIEHIEHNIRKENISGYKKSEFSDLLQEKQRIIQNRYHEFHPDLLEMKASMCIWKLDNVHTATEAETLLDGLASVKEELFKYYGRKHFCPLYLEFEYQSNYAKYHPGKDWYDTRFRKDLDELLYYYGDCIEQKANILAEALGSIINIDSYEADEIFKEMDRLSEDLWLDPIASFQIQCNKLYLQHAGVSGYDNSIEELRHLKSDLVYDEKNWMSVMSTIELCEQAQQLFGYTSSVVSLFEDLNEELKEVAGDKSEISVLCGVSFLAAKLNSMELLTNKENLFRIIEEYTENAGKLGVNVAPFYMLNGVNRISEQGDTTNVKYFKKALQSNENYYAEDIENLHSSQRNIYENWLNFMLNMGGDDNNINECVEYLAPLVEAELDSIKIEHMETYRVMAMYYLQKGDIQKVDKIAESCIQYFHNNLYATNSYYIAFSQMLATLYVTGYGDMEKARLLVEQLRTDAEKIKTFLGYNEYLMLLRLCYDFIELKSPDDFGLLYSYMSSMALAIQEYVATQSADNLDDIIWNHYPYILTKVSNIYKVLSFMRKNNPYAMPQSQWDTNVSQVRTFLKEGNIEDLLERNPSLKNTNNYLTWLGAMANINEFLFEDLGEAEKYYKLLNEKNDNGIGWYGGFLMRNNQWTKAKEVANLILPKFYEKLNEHKEKGSISTLSDDASGFFTIYYRNGDYNRAIEFAKLYSKIREEYILKNFDTFTTQERESFIMQGGAGGAGLYALLPYLKNDISADAYNAALREKGLLLRSSERVKSAILNSGNKELIAANDSIRMLSQSLLAVKDYTSAGKMEMAVKLRQRIENLERYISSETSKYKDNEKVPTWMDVRNSLDKNEVAIEFVMSDSIMSALVLCSDNKHPKFVQILDHESVLHIMSYMQDPVNYTENMKKIYDIDGEWLYDKIWKPLLPLIGKAQRVYYSPIGLLNALSFAAFKAPDGSFLIDNYDLRQVSTTANIVARNKKKNTEHNYNALVIGGLCYEDIQEEFMHQDIEEARQSHEDVVRQREAQEIFQFLPFSYIEQENVCSVLKKNNTKVCAYTAMNAKEEDVRKLISQASSPEILHISTHGFSFTDFQQAMNITFIRNRGQLTSLNCAGLALSNANPTWEGDMLPAESDNILTADEIASFDLRNTKLAVLSACNTALGATSYEGVMGLQRGLKQAGVETLCLSLWNVNDASSSSLMSSFYENWLGTTKTTMSSAMHEAMKKQRALTPSPYYWAPFILIDDVE